MGTGEGRQKLSGGFQRTGTTSRAASALACYSNQEISPRMGGGGVGVGRRDRDFPAPSFSPW